MGALLFVAKPAMQTKIFQLLPLSTRRRMTGRRFWVGLPANFSKRTRIGLAG